MIVTPFQNNAGLRQTLRYYHQFRPLMRTHRSQENMMRSTTRGQDYQDQQAISLSTVFEECYTATTWSVNPLEGPKIERILQRLIGPAPQSYFVLNRAAPTFLTQCHYLLKPGYQFAIDIHNNKDWDVVAKDEAQDIGWERIPRVDNIPTTLELAHLSLDAPDHAHNIGLEAMQQLHLTLGTDIRGRASADAAFTFCMAGVTHPELYDLLAIVARYELQRIAPRPSFLSKYILQIVEKLAAAGIQDLRHVYHVAANALQTKGEYESMQVLLRTCQFDMLSPRPLLWLWRFSTTQDKPEYNEPRTNDKMDWASKFADSSKPLIVDIGCGMGISLIGLSTLRDGESTSHQEGQIDADWHNSNYIGCDLNPVLIRFAQGIAKRWNLEQRLQFAVCSGQDMIDSLTCASLILVQFPSPFLVNTSGNSQLPSTASDFMVTEHFLRSAARLLQPSNGKLMFVSNCEDVAVSMRDLALKIGMQCVPTTMKITEPSNDGMTLRTQQWIDRGGKRAVGSEWSRVPLFPHRGASESEVARQFNKTPIHRCLVETVAGTIY